MKRLIAKIFAPLVKQAVQEEFKKRMGAAVDAHMYGRSWAVFCLEGEQVSFVNFDYFDKSNLMEIMRIIKGKANPEKVMFDAPPFARDMWLECLKEEL